MFLAAAFSAAAQDIFSDMPNVVVHQDSAIVNLLNDKISGRERKPVEVQGYRVQLYSSNRQQTAKVEAFELEKRLTDMKLDYPVYVLYNPPFWKVRVGDFTTSEEASEAREELIKLLPDIVGDIYVVRDKITIIQ